jgi:hypothetical protein
MTIPATPWKGDAYKCGECSHFEIRTEHTRFCVACGGEELENVAIRPRIGPNAGKVFRFDLVTPRYVTPAEEADL